MLILTEMSETMITNGDERIELNNQVESFVLIYDNNSRLGLKCFNFVSSSINPFVSTNHILISINEVTYFSHYTLKPL